MGFPRVAMSKISSFGRGNSAFVFPLPAATLPVFKTLQKPSSQISRAFSNFSPMDTKTHSSPSILSPVSSAGGGGDRWRPMCLYHTQGKCTRMNDPIHLEKFNHDCSRDLQVTDADCQCKQPQDFDFFLVLDLEGKVEILEFPVLMIDANTMAIVDLFHRFVKPSAMSGQRINEYIENKYGKLGIDRIWHDTALSFSEVLQQFEAWLNQHCLWERKLGGHLNRAAFVTW
uniref:Putative exonuclease domain-containing protein At3g15140 n=1 Tax=Rhizophora mucronata TaxID=61149 RepID=A0A2P2IVM9_RHIMU